MPNEYNLIPIRSESEAREKGKTGGKASGEARREKKRLRDCAETLLSLPVADPWAWNSVSAFGVAPEDIDNRMLMVTGLFVRASKGDVAASKELRDLVGEGTYLDGDAPVAAYTGLPARALGKAYVDVNRDIDERRHRFYDFKGGRGSLKSSFCGLKLVDQIMLNESFCGLAVRQIKDTLKDSVYAQIAWAIDELGLTEDFHCTKNPMEIRRKSTGQIIYFRGAEDPMKIKSIKPPRGMHIGVVWIEEADQLRGAEAFRSILQSAMRGGDDCLVFRSYNTPRSRTHYLNEEEREPNPARIIHHSHFKDAPPEWLGRGFYDLAEHLRATNETAYRHEYDGEAVGHGANVFENVATRDITDKEIAGFDRCYYGIDWGWYPDPFHFCECYFNAADRKLYIYGELRCHRTSNEELAEKLDDWKSCRITADSGGEGPKSIADFKSRGFDMRPAVKGPGSVEYSMKWLASLSGIVIDPARCPYAAEEFLEYEHEKDREGNIISGYPDANDHAISAVRYALESVWKRRGQ